MLAILWLYSGIQAYLSIRRGDVMAHQRWMIRNYALTLAGVTLRLLLGVFGAAGIGFNEGYQVIAWLCWVPNLVIAEWVFQKPSSEKKSEAVKSETAKNASIASPA